MTDAHLMEYAPESFTDEELVDLLLGGNHNPQVVGIAGRKRSGKTTVANALREYLEDDYFLHVELANMSDPLHEALLRYNPWVRIDLLTENPGWMLPGVVLYRELTERFGYEGAKDMFEDYRRQLKDLGTEGIRHDVPDYWVDRINDKINRSQANVYIVSAVRFPNELKIMPKVLIHTINVTDPMTDPHGSEANVERTVEEARNRGIPIVTLESLSEVRGVVRAAASYLDKGGDLL